MRWLRTIRMAGSGALVCAALFACGNDTDTVDDAYDLQIPEGFPPLVIPADNPTTHAGVELGRALYYDTRLSPDGSRACANCHQQDKSFSNPATPGVLPHINLAWSENFLWDGRFEGTLEEAMIMEVEEFFMADVERLKEPDLEDMFEAAFGDREVTTRRAAYALAQFQRTLVSGNSRYDRYSAGDTGALSDSEIRGMGLFFGERGECFHCHATKLFTDNKFHNIGLDVAIADTGRGHVTGEARNDGQWKTPTLRNIEHTGPYMHDDRFATLEEVVAFYSEGVKLSDTLDTLITIGGFALTEEEQADLVAFLKSLTDDSYMSNPALANPNL